MVESLLLTALRISTFNGTYHLTNASGFFFEIGNKLFVVTSRHVVIDDPSKHFPDRIEIEIHTDQDNLAKSIGFSIPLYRDGKSLWLEGRDGSGDVDIAVLQIDRAALPQTLVYSAFAPDSLAAPDEDVEIGKNLLVVGFPMGFHDSLHHMPVVRHAAVASSFGLRFQGKGYFLTDARTHRGTSGAAVVMRNEPGSGSSRDPNGKPLPFTLLGVHSARLDVGTRDLELDEALGLNVTWYADILLKLTETAARSPMPVRQSFQRSATQNTDG